MVISPVELEKCGHLTVILAVRAGLMIFAEETGWRKGETEEPEVLLVWMADLFKI